jgi:hypothetical protein
MLFYDKKYQQLKKYHAKIIIYNAGYITIKKVDLRIENNTMTRLL